MNIEIDWKKFGNPEKHPEYQTKEICLKAVKQNCFVIEYVKNQTEDICIEAVKQNGLALQYVINQTEEICLEALRNRWSNDTYDMINIPIEGKFLKEINRMKLINGPMK